jgi:hypothetical protein
MLPFIQAAANSADNLAQVQAGFTQTPSVSIADLKIILIILGILILVGVAAAFISWRRRLARQRKMGWSSIANPQHIWEILTKAVYRQANISLELYHQNHNVTYKGTLGSLENDSFLVLSLSDSPPADLEFKDTPGILHLTFRPSVKEPLEHYQFTTHVEESRYVKLRPDWREYQLVVPIPKVLTSAQRRSFLRLEPSPPFEVFCTLYQVPEDTFPDLSALEEITTGQILDISIGGAQLTLPTNATLKETQRFVGIIKLPTENLDVEIANPTMVLLIQLLSQDFYQKADTLESEAHRVLRLRFLGRYLQEPVNKTWVYRALSQISLDDLAHWLQAYQRYLIKKRHNLLPMDGALRPPNMFPSQPPKRPPMKDE